MTGLMSVTSLRAEYERARIVAGGHPMSLRGSFVLCLGLAACVVGLTVRVAQRSLAVHDRLEPPAPALPSTSPAQSPSLGGALPRFEANAGQWDPVVRFVARRGLLTVFLTDDGAALRLDGSGADRGPGTILGPRARPAVVMLRVAGAGAAHLEGEQQLETQANYFIGNDPSRWRHHVPTFARVRSVGVRPGVDVVWHEGASGVEYDLAIAAGADEEVTFLNFDGASKLEVRGDGTLAIETSAGTLLQPPPRVIQDGRTLTSRYRLRGAGRVAFEIDGRDRSREMLIDPTVLFSTYLGGSYSDGATGIAVGPGGYAYVTGTTASVNFPTVNPLQPALADGGAPKNVVSNAFVGKWNAAGSALVYCTYLGGYGDDQGAAIAVDSSGAAYVTGTASSSDFPTKNPFQAAPGLASDTSVFVSKLSPDGSELVYSTYLGGHYNNQATGIAIDASLSAYVTGWTSAFDFPTEAPFQAALGSPDAFNAFITKFSPAGSSLVYSTYMGGSQSESGNAIAVDADDNAYVVGDTTSTDFPTKNPFQSSNRSQAASTESAFALKLNAAGAALVYSTYLGGTGRETAQGVAVDGSQNAYLTGLTTSSNFPTQNPFQASLTGSSNAFVSKLSASGSALVYSTYLGGNGQDIAFGIAVDAQGNAYVAGSTSSSNFPVLYAVQPAVGAAGATDAFVSKFDASGAALLYSTYFGGGASTQANSIAIDGSGDAFIAGQTTSSTLPIHNALQPKYGGAPSDAFVAEIGANPVDAGVPVPLSDAASSDDGATGMFGVGPVGGGEAGPDEDGSTTYASDASAPADASATPDTDAGTDGVGASDGVSAGAGCGCRVGATSRPSERQGCVLLLGAAVVGAARRRRRGRR
jgi:hypothetical protein